MNALRPCTLLAIICTLWVVMVACERTYSHKISQKEFLRISNFMQNGAYENAVGVLDSIEKLNDLTSRLLLFRGICFQVEKDCPNALKYFDSALRSAPRDSCKLKQEILENRALSNRFCFQLDKQKSLEDYLSAHRIAINCSQATKWDSTTNAFNAAMLAISLKNLELADSLSNYLKHLFPQEPDGYEVKGAIFESKNKLNLAILEYDTIISVLQKTGKDNRLKFVFLSRANLYQKINNLPAACEDWQKAVELGTEEAKLKLDSFCTKTR